MKKFMLSLAKKILKNIRNICKMDIGDNIYRKEANYIHDFKECCNLRKLRKDMYIYEFREFLI